MNTIINFFKKNINFSNFWFRNGCILIVLSILSNHLIDPENFPFHKDYEFPLFPIGVSIVTGFIIIFIAKSNFNYFEKKHFTKKIKIQTLLRFLFSTLGYISLLYLVLYFSLNGLINGIESYSVYHLITGLTINLLIGTLAIVLLFSADVYKLHKFKAIEGTLKVKQGGKITLVKYPEISIIYSENKVVYIVKTDGTSIITDFTLNDVESKISKQSFFRANRQIILHPRSIERVQSIENGKLSVVLKTTFSGEKNSQINISRYKKQVFMDWFDSKL